MQTAVEYLEERLILSFGDELTPLRGFFVIAKEMEKKQITDAWLSAWKDSMLNPLSDDCYQDLAEEYYVDTFKNLIADDRAGYQH
jgi:hypothetical protein